MPLGHRKNTLSSSKSNADTDGASSADEDETVVTSEQGNILTHIISQLRPGADLSRVTLPTFILEPRSMLERITNFMAHPENLLSVPTIDDPVQRFVAVTKFYLSGWHIKPPGVKKPLNPILGEVFTGWWDYEDGTRGYYVSEQTSHHPPKSSYFFMAPAQGIRIDGTLKPRSKFLGNSVGSFMEGIAVMRFLTRGERYFITQPNMYARGILFGKMKYELGDHAQVRCPESGLEVDLDFKVKGWMGGSYNSIGGFIKDTNTGKNLYELSGYWHTQMYIKDLSTGKKELLFDAARAKPSFPKSRPLEEQGERESQRLWAETTAAIKKADQRAATDEKTKIEDEQRKEAAERGDQVWNPRLFRPAPQGDEQSLDWVVDATVDHSAAVEKQIQQILGIAPILPGQKAGEGGEQAQAQAPQQQQQQQQKKAAPSQNDGGGDLIDFGQNDGASQQQQQQQQQQQKSQPSQQQQQQQPAAQKQNPQPMSGQLQEPLIPSKSAPGDPIRRMDSMGGEETFLDAES